MRIPTREENNKRIRNLGLPIIGFPEPNENTLRLLQGAKSTKDLHTVDGEYNKKRKVLHDDIAFDFLKGNKPQEAPVATFYSGGSGSGKSKIYKAVPNNWAQHISNSVIIDPDAIKEKLPEYQTLASSKHNMLDLAAASISHEESSDIAKNIKQFAYNLKLNIVFDGTGNGKTSAFLNKIREAYDRGYEIQLVHIHLPTELAVERSITRAVGDTDIGGNKISGYRRMIPVSEIRKIHRHSATNHLAWRNKKFISNWLVYSNNVADGEDVVLIAKGGMGLINQLSDEYYEVQKKADETL